MGDRKALKSFSAAIRTQPNTTRSMKEKLEFESLWEEPGQFRRNNKKKKQKIKFAFLFQNKEERNASFLSRLFDCCIFGPREQKEKMGKEEENNCLLEI